jgi:hypothetical protein
VITPRRSSSTFSFEHPGAAARIVDMGSTNTPPRRRSGIATVSLVSAVAFAVAVLPSLSIKGFGDMVAGVLFCGWVSLPLLFLGLMKLFRDFPITHLVLLVLGLAGSFGAVILPYGRGSTSALGMVFVPLYLLVIYCVAGFILFCVKVYRT